MFISNSYSFISIICIYLLYTRFLFCLGNESPSFVVAEGFNGGDPELPNEISAPYEVPQFPIEQIEKKLAIQRQLHTK